MLQRARRQKVQMVKQRRRRKLRKLLGLRPKDKVMKPLPKKKRKRATQLSVRPPLSKGISYVIKQVPRHSLRFGIIYNSDFAGDIKTSIEPQAYAKFRRTIFGPYLKMPSCNFQGQIMKCLMLLEIEQYNANEIYIRHGNGNVLRFN